MDQPFAQALTDWTAYYALMGGAAATLLGLLFVAVSLRLNIFRQLNVRDIRDFAAFTLATFLVAIVVAGLALAPHGSEGTLAPPLLLIGLSGFIAVGWIFLEWLRLDLPQTRSQAERARQRWQGLLIMAGLAAPYLGLLAIALLLWRGHPGALGWLAVVEASLLVVGTAATWLMLSHAGNQAEDRSGDA